MSCLECMGAARKALIERLRTAALAHGFELWSREGSASLTVLALPTTPSHGTPQALIDTFKETGIPGLPRSPSRAQQARSLDRRSVLPATRNSAGQLSYMIDGSPPIELVFQAGIAGLRA